MTRAAALGEVQRCLDALRGVVTRLERQAGPLAEAQSLEDLERRVAWLIDREQLRALQSDEERRYAEHLLSAAAVPVPPRRRRG
jgi:hypothetical protein